MGSVLSFAPRVAATTRKTESDGAMAAVIIFPGVRYEQVPAQDAATHVAKDRPRH